MLEYARRVKPKVFLQMSTDEVYGPAPEGVEHPEWSPILPSNPYSASKAAQEALCIAYWRTYGVPVVIANSMNVFGERQDPEKFIPLCISKIAKGEPVPIHGRGGVPHSPKVVDGRYHWKTVKTGSRFYLHARNVSDALLYLTQFHDTSEAEYLDQWPWAFSGRRPRPQRYNVVGDVEMNNLELAQLIAEIMGEKLQYELIDFHSARPGHDPRYALDGSKLASLGWKPPVAFEDSLRKTIQWTLDHSEWLAPTPTLSSR